MVAFVAVVVALVGAVVYGLASNPKVAELGRIAFAAGLLVTLLAFAGHAIRILPP
jgi:hypothetical protein